MRRQMGRMGAALPVFAPEMTVGLPPLDVRSFGARGDGVAIDSPPINRAIAAAAAQGGGVVVIPAGRYLCFSIRLQSRVTLSFAPGAVLVAADPAVHGGSYDPPEDNPHDVYQDFGHSHWHNSLIWGVDVEDVAIIGPGLIDGSALTREGPGSPWSRGAVGDRPLSMPAASKAEVEAFDAQTAAMVGLGNKAIALKNARRVVLGDFTVLKGGHIAVLTTFVDDLTIDGITIDTNRDGIDLDAVRGARVRNVTVNSPNDDAIVLKSSLASGALRPCEDVVITGCRVTGYDVGTVLDGRFATTLTHAPDCDGPTGRIKLGTESNGGFRNIRVSDCTFERSRGLALESVDGGMLEDVQVDAVRMQSVTTAPIFIRVGDRRRAPPGTGMAAARHICLRGIVARDIEPRYAAIIAGLAASPVEDVVLEDIDLEFRGGGSMADAVRPIPEVETAYPEPSMFGVTPAWGLYVRHVRGLSARDVVLATVRADERPALVCTDGAGVRFDASTSCVHGQIPQALKS